MVEWKKCDFCGEVAVTLLKIELHTQHCNPTLQDEHYICDECLETRGIDPDVLVRAISPETP